MLVEALEIVKESLGLTLGYFVDSSKRIHYIYLLSSLIIAFLFFKYTIKSGDFIKYFFAKEVWLSSSAMVDYFLIIFNSFIKVLFIAPFLIYSLKISFYTKDWLITLFGYLDFNFSKVLLVGGYTVVYVLVQDFGTYFVHYLQHRMPLLWEFHKVHHSATSLNPITQYRIHPVELIINNIKVIALTGLVMGVFDYLGGHTISSYTLMGVNILSFLFLLLGANLRHSIVPIKYPDWLESFLISPFQHQIHHSNKEEHFNKNLGSKFAFWDRLMGTLIKSKNASKFQFGLNEENVDFSNPLKNIYMPFVKSWRLLIKVTRFNP